MDGRAPEQEIRCACAQAAAREVFYVMLIRRASLPGCACSTCRKAVAYLESKGVSVRGFRNLNERPLTEDEVRALAAKLGGVETLC
jgi:hypothetical protein